MLIQYVKTKKPDGSEYDNPQFTTLDKIIISDTTGLVSSITDYYGSDEELIGLADINEYDWKYIVDKIKFNSDCNIGLLVEKEKTDLVGTSKTDIFNVSTTFFPTLMELDEESSSNILYFGSLTIGRQRLIMIDVPVGYDKLELYDTVESSSDPVITVNFNLDSVEGADKPESRIYSKRFWFVITLGGETSISNINLSYYSWRDNINSFRNMKDYLLRNDDKCILDSNIDVVDNISGDDNPVWIDETSGTLVGNKVIESRPIISRIVSNCNTSTSWDSKVSYRQGQIVSWGQNDWISLEDNKNENPMLSDKWIISGKEKAKISRLCVRAVNTTTSATPANIYPGVVTIVEDQSKKSFKITYKLGYVLTSKYSDLGDSTLSKQINEYNCYKDGSLSTTLRINPSSFIDSINNRVIIEFERYRCLVSLSSNETSYTLEDNGVVVDNSYVRLGDTATIEITSSTNIGSITNFKRDILVEGTLMESSVSTDLLTIKDNKVYISEVMKYPASYKYSINIVSALLKITFTEYLGFILSDTSISVESGTSYIVKLYPINGLDEGLTIDLGSRTMSLTSGAEMGVTYRDSSGTVFKLSIFNIDGYYELAIGNIQSKFEIKVWK